MDVIVTAQDEKMIAALRQNGTKSNRDLTGGADIKEPMLRASPHRPEENKTIGLAAMRNCSATGYDAVAAGIIQVKERSAAEVGSSLAKFLQVAIVNLPNGIYDLAIQVIARQLDDLDFSLTYEIALMTGVERLFLGRSLKNNPEWLPR